MQESGEARKPGKTDTASTGMPRGRPRPRVGAALSAGLESQEARTQECKRAGKQESRKDGYRFDRDAAGDGRDLVSGRAEHRAGEVRKQESRKDGYRFDRAAVGGGPDLVSGRAEHRAGEVRKQESRKDGYRFDRAAAGGGPDLVSGRAERRAGEVRKQESRKARTTESRKDGYRSDRGCRGGTAQGGFAFGLVRHALRSADTAPTGCRGGTAETSCGAAPSVALESQKAGKQERRIPFRPGCRGDGRDLVSGRAERRAGESESRKARKQDTAPTGMPRGWPRPCVGPRRAPCRRAGKPDTVPTGCRARRRSPVWGRVEAPCWRAGELESWEADIAPTGMLRGDGPDLVLGPRRASRWRVRKQESRKAGKTDTAPTGCRARRPRPRVGPRRRARKQESKKAGKTDTAPTGCRGGMAETS